MNKVIALANQKGGVGKTTTTANLTYALIQKGQRVLAIDLDPQASLTICFGQDPVLLEEARQTIYWGLCDDQADLASLIIPGTPDLVPASIQLSIAEEEFRRDWEPVKFVRGKLPPLIDRYDFILIDCPPSLSLLTVNALVAAQAVLIPVKTDYLSIQGVRLLLHTVDSVRKKSNPFLEILGVLPTIYDGRNNHDRGALDKLHSVLEPTVHVFPPIHRSTRFDNAVLEGRPLLAVNPDTPSVDTYYQLAEHLIAYAQQS
jgi:chromosome partitioning protein